ncbi:PREDICTED: uncharacterized protein LOC108965360 [Bactrocera latifrons]|uniref:uncharacterized protein LOC108965360 n=1 Tax=Bactrocera latifrons TaxID=174628 RepID=UPI0008DDC2C8|nr:PREDICTED: uncharacterized protein LOC108965360 [Bactrocera latifrons]
MYIILAYILIQLITNPKFLLAHTTEMELTNTTVEPVTWLPDCNSDEKNVCICYGNGTLYSIVTGGVYNIEIYFSSRFRELFFSISKPLHNLRRLDLSQNRLQTIWRTETTVTTTPRPLKIFQYSNIGINLTLAVCFNYIAKLQPEKYKGSELNITVINLSGNRLREFTLDWLVASHITCHFEINLEHNLIKNIFALHDFSSTTNDCAREIKSTGNPVVCDCAFAWIYSGNYRSLFNGLHCVQASTKLIKDLKHIQLCARKPVMCPNKCNLSPRKFVKLLVNRFSAS